MLKLIFMVAFAGYCNCRDLIYARYGERVHIPCKTNAFSYDTVTWTKENYPDSVTIFLYEDKQYNISFPDHHYFEEDYKFPNLTLLAVTEGDGGIYRCIRLPQVVEEVEIIINGTTELRNMVYRYSSQVQLAHFVKLDEDATASFTHQYINPSLGPKVAQIYYASSAGGIVPEQFLSKFEAIQHMPAVFIDELTFYTTGTYKYIEVDPPNTYQKQFTLTGTNGLNCYPKDKIIEGTLQTHNCSADAGYGHLKQVLTWFKNGQPVDPEDCEELTNGTTLISMYHFVPEVGDEEAEFTCELTFRHSGIDSPEYEDTSKPDYIETCSIKYPSVDYAVRNIQILPRNTSETPVPAVTVGETLECYADGYPKGLYKWTCEGHGIAYGESYMIKENMVSENTMSCECEVNNTLSNGTTYFQRADITIFPTYGSGVFIEPSDTVAYLDENATLACTALDLGRENDDWKVQWLFERINEIQSIYMSDKHGSGILSDWQDYSEVGEAKHDLVVKRVSYSMGGTYHCQEFNFPLFRIWAAQLTVRSNVKCSASQTQSGKAELSCEVEYSGALEPIVRWFKGDVVLDTSQRATKFTSSDNIMLVENRFLTDSMSEYRCKAEFQSNGKVISSDECTIHLVNNEN